MLILKGKLFSYMLQMYHIFKEEYCHWTKKDQDIKKTISMSNYIRKGSNIAERCKHIHVSRQYGKKIHFKTDLFIWFCLPLAGILQVESVFLSVEYAASSCFPKVFLCLLSGRLL